MRIFLLAVLIFSCSTGFSQVFNVKMSDPNKGFECAQEYEGAEEFKILRVDSNGIYRIYDYDNDLRFIAGIKNREYHGEFVKLWEGTKEIEGQFSNGQRIGLWKYYNDSGNVVYDIAYGRDTITERIYKRDVNHDVACTITKTTIGSGPKSKKIEKKECRDEFNNDHLKTVLKLNKLLSNQWKLEQASAPDGYGNNTLYFHLFTPLTAHARGNEGVSLGIFDKRYKANILSKDPDEHTFFETKS